MFINKINYGNEVEFKLDNVLLEIKNLKTSFRIKDKHYAAVDDVSLNVNKNEVLAIVGESGCGKSALAFSLMGLHNRAKVEGEILYKGKNLVNISNREFDSLRGNELGMVFQDPLSALNPLATIGKQISEVIYLHNKRASAKELKNRVIELIDKVGIPRPEYVYNQFPHEISGGMRQRIVVAMAIANNPSLLIADEPTTALDVTIQSQILDLMKDLKEAMDSGIILITHDLGVVSEMADRVAVMYAGQIVEIADVFTLFENPQHPYTKSLFQSLPGIDENQEELQVIQGIVPPLHLLPRGGCRFSPRIPWISDEAHEKNPQLHEIETGHFVRCTCYKHFYFPNEKKKEESHGTA